MWYACARKNRGRFFGAYVVATNRDLGQLMDQGKFRRDLYFRLSVVPLQLPPLRERREDIELLLKGLTRELAKNYRLHAPVYAKSAIKLLKNYHWPGNIRELKNLCERLLILCSGKVIEAESLPPEIRQTRPATTGQYQSNFVLPDQGLSLNELEENLIRQALGKTLGNRTRAAHLLGLSRDTLLYRIKKYAIEV